MEEAFVTMWHYFSVYRHSVTLGTSLIKAIGYLIFLFQMSVQLK